MDRVWKLIVYNNVFSSDYIHKCMDMDGPDNHIQPPKH